MFRRHGYVIGYSPYDRDTAARRMRLGKRYVVSAWQCGLLFHHGALVATLDAGSVRRWRRGFVLRTIDLRPWILTAPTQEIPTADGFTVKVTVAGRARVIDAPAFVAASQNVHEALYLAIQIALREVIASATLDQLLAARSELGAQLLAAVRGVDGLGVDLDALELKDIVLPAELKRAQAEVAIARAEGLASLERARGENAALRSLANAARLAQDNPALLQLRLIQQLGAAPGSTVVLGNPPLTAS